MSTEAKANKFNAGGTCGTATAGNSTNIDIRPSKSMRVRAYSLRFKTGKGSTMITAFRTAQDAGELIIENSPLANFASVEEGTHSQHPCDFNLRSRETARMRLTAPSGGLTAGDVMLVLHGELIPE
jgi:hypothetical protein